MPYASRAALLAVASILAACGTTAFDGDDDRDAFRRAAVSWVGAPLDDMIAEMVENDLQIARRNRLLIKSGYDVNQPFE